MIVIGLIAGAVVLAPTGASTPMGYNPPPPPPDAVRSHWDALADCESGEWGDDGVPIAGTADWSSTEHSLFQGGLQFHPKTWDGFRDPDMPADAQHASRDVQITVGERVQEAQGWKAWPVCSIKVGLR